MRPSIAYVLFVNQHGMIGQLEKIKRQQSYCIAPSKVRVDKQIWSVVCLRGGERGTCLGPPFLGAPPWGVTHVNFPYFWWKTYYPHIWCTTKQIISKYSAFKGAPYRNCTVQVLSFQRGPQQPLKCVSTLHLNFIEGAHKRNCNV